MSNPVPSASKRRKTAWLGAAALAGLIAGGAVESGLVARGPGLRASAYRRPRNTADALLCRRGREGEAGRGVRAGQGQHGGRPQ